jgi:hypothetical protein
MSFQEKRAFVSLFSTLLSSAVYSAVYVVCVFQKHQAERVALPEELKFWVAASQRHFSRNGV